MVRKGKWHKDMKGLYSHYRVCLMLLSLIVLSLKEITRGARYHHFFFGIDDNLSNQYRHFNRLNPNCKQESLGG